MNIEYLDHGFERCPFIRIYSDSDQGFLFLKTALNTSYLQKKNFLLSNLPNYDYSIRLEFCFVNKSTKLSRSSNGADFKFELNEQSHIELEQLIDELIDHEGFYWLNTGSKISILLCRHEHGFT